MIDVDAGWCSFRDQPLSRVILSGAGSSRSEVSAQSKDPYTLNTVGDVARHSPRDPCCVTSGGPRACPEFCGRVVPILGANLRPPPVFRGTGWSTLRGMRAHISRTQKAAHFTTRCQGPICLPEIPELLLFVVPALHVRTYVYSNKYFVRQCFASGCAFVRTFMRRNRSTRTLIS